MMNVLKKLFFRRQLPSAPSFLGGIDHFALTVPNMEQACRFFCDVLKCKELFTIGEFRSEDNYMKEHLDVHPRTIMREHRMLQCSDGFKISLFEYESPDQNKTPPKNSDIGGHHLAFSVADINEAIRYLEANGLQIMGRPVVFREGPNAGITSVYFLSPWGLQLEFVCYPP